MSRLCKILLCGLLLLATTANAVSLGGVQIGGDATVTQPVSGDTVLINGKIEVLAEIHGSLKAMGDSVNIQRAIGKDLFAAGRDVTLAAPVAGNARIFSQSIEITPDGKVNGNAALAGQSLQVKGPIGGRLQIGGDDVLIDSAIGGDVDASGTHLQLGPNARISGRLRYSSAAELVRDPASEVQGSIEHTAPDGRWQRWISQRRSYSDSSDDDRWDWGGPAWLSPGSPPWRSWTHPYYRDYGTGFVGGFAILTALLIGALSPGFAQRLGATVSTQWGGAVLLGLAALIGTPIVAVILVVTIIGIPIAVLLGVAWAFLLFLGYAASGVALGDVALHRLAPARYNEAALRILAAALAMVFVIIAARMPVFGGLVSFIATLTGVGAFLMAMRSNNPNPPARPA
jgi:hypothetical protein